MCLGFAPGFPSLARGCTFCAMDESAQEPSSEELWRELGLAYRRDRTLSVANKTFIAVVRQLSDYLKKTEA